MCAAMLAACSGKPEPSLGASIAEMAPSPSLSAAAAGQPPAFVGVWAASTHACGSKTWTFTVDRLEAPGGLSCSFDRASPSSAGYEVDGICSVGKAVSPTRLDFTLSGAGGVRSLTISGGPFAEPVALARCDGLKEAAAVPPKVQG
ncbi:MAG: hypothetical protein WDM92_03660 [Caulobacteraceae bacterium]